MSTYPYYVVEWWTGRMDCPPQWQHVPVIRRQFESGRIGGKVRHSEKFTDEYDAIDRAVRLQREGHEPEVLVAEDPRRHMRRISWRHRPRRPG